MRDLRDRAGSPDEPGTPDIRVSAKPRRTSGVSVLRQQGLGRVGRTRRAQPRPWERRGGPQRAGFPVDVPQLWLHQAPGSTRPRRPACTRAKRPGRRAASFEPGNVVTELDGPEDASVGPFRPLVAASAASTAHAVPRHGCVCSLRDSPFEVGGRRGGSRPNATPWR